MPRLLIILIFACAFQSFFLLPFHHIKGVFNISDVGVALIGLSLFWPVLVKQASLSRLNNGFTLMIAAYLFFVLMQASFASMNFGQRLIDGIIIARHQLYYFLFFLFLIVLDDKEKVYRFMFALSVLGVFLTVVALVNYFGPTILHHRWAEGHGERAGITRALVPGANLILMAGLWQLIRYLDSKGASLWMLGYFLMSVAMVLFRQTRGRIIAFAITIILLLINRRQFRLLGALALSALVLAASLSMVMEKNILTNPFLQAYEDISKGTGTWGGRVWAMRQDWKIIKENPFVGNGAMVIRSGAVTGQRSTADVWLASYGTDLGYMHWVKFFGIPGAVWMLAFIAMFYARLRRVLRKPDTDRVMAAFAGYMFTYIVIAEITLDFFTTPQGIIVVCLTLAMLLLAEGAGTKEEKEKSGPA